jgi:hypothetical protein
MLFMRSENVKDKTLLNLITTLGIVASIFFLFRKKGALKDWFLIYLFKTLISTLLDGPVIKKKYLQYPYRYFPNFFDSNIVFLYILFPLSCVMYNQFTYKMKPIKAILSVFLFSGPMTLIENWLEKKTRLVRYRKGWNSFYTFSVLSFTFLLVKAFIEWIRLLDKKRNTSLNP